MEMMMKAVKASKIKMMIARDQTKKILIKFLFFHVILNQESIPTW